MDHTETRSFAGIYGQRVPTQVLAHLVESDRLPGTLLFSGPGGVGKLATALSLAKRLHCREDAAADCDCPSCRAIRTGAHPEVMVLSRDRRILVEEMREITAIAGLRSAAGQERVIILDRAESITEAAANAALKTLEEPGAHVRFILITDTPAVLLPTVRSRAYRLRFSLLSPEAIGEFARAIGDDVDEDVTKEGISFARGRPGMYLRWRHSEGYRDLAREAAEWIKDVLEIAGRPSLESALEWKKEFWLLAERLHDSERGMRLPRGGNAFEIGRHFAAPSKARVSGAGYLVSPINWRVEEASGRESRWGQGRKAMLLAGSLRRLLALELGGRTASALGRLQDFMEKLRFNCSFDIALERLYFGLAGLSVR